LQHFARLAALTGCRVVHPVSTAFALDFIPSVIVTTSQSAIPGFRHNVNKVITLMGC